MKKTFKHIMLDLETMGTKSNSVIVSIAAVPFDLETGEISHEYFYKKVNLQSCLDVGLKVNGDTIFWWLQQSEKSRQELIKNSENALNIDLVLDELSEYIKFNVGISANIHPDFEIWGNGARFDIGILEDAYAACGYKQLPWNFRNERDVRTLVSLAPHIKKEFKFEGIEHNPVHDCFHQIKYCHAIYKHLMNKPEQFEYQYELSNNCSNILFTCDVCGSHPNTIVTTSKGTFCLKHAKY